MYGQKCVIVLRCTLLCSQINNGSPDGGDICGGGGVKIYIYQREPKIVFRDQRTEILFRAVFAMNDTHTRIQLA